MANPKIQLRHDTSTNWKEANPILLEGEVAIEVDTNRSKVGDGETDYKNLQYTNTPYTFNTPLLATPVKETNGNLKFQPPLVFDKNNNAAYRSEMSDSVVFGGNNVSSTDNPSLISNPNWWEDYGYVLIPYEVGQVACLSATLGKSSTQQHTGANLGNIVFGKYANGVFEPIFLPSNRQTIILSNNRTMINTGLYRYNDTATISSINNKNITGKYGGNNIVVQILPEVIICTEGINSKLYYEPFTDIIIKNRIAEINSIMLIPLYVSDGKRGVSYQPFTLSEDNMVDGNMIWNINDNLWYALESGEQTHNNIEAYIDQNNIPNNLFQQGIVINKYSIDLEYDNDTIVLNDNNQLSVPTLLPTDTYTELTIGSSGSTVVLPENGYICMFGYIQAVSIAYIILFNNSTQLRSASYNNIGNSIAAYIPGRKGDTITYNYRYDQTPTINKLIFIKAKS